MKFRFVHLAIAFVIFEAALTYLIGVGVWPQSLSWLVLGLLATTILLLNSYYALLLVVLSIPFYIVLPNAQFDTLSMWRPIFAWLFLVWAGKQVYAQYLKGKLVELPKKILGQLFSRDKYIIIFGISAVLSATIAEFPEQAI